MLYRESIIASHPVELEQWPQYMIEQVFGATKEQFLLFSKKASGGTDLKNYASAFAVALALFNFTSMERDLFPQDFSWYNGYILEEEEEYYY